MHLMAAKLLLVAAIAFLPYAFFRFLYLRRHPKPRFAQREAMLCLFILFMAGLLFLVFQPGPAFYNLANPAETLRERISFWQDINFTPFSTLQRFWNLGWSAPFIVNVLGNIFMFSPLGFCLPLLWYRWQNILKTVLAGALFSLSVECIQLFIGRSVDIDDLLLNTLGALVGYLGYWLFVHLVPKAKALSYPKKEAA